MWSYFKTWFAKEIPVASTPPAPPKGWDKIEAGHEIAPKRRHALPIRFFRHQSYWSEV